MAKGIALAELPSLRSRVVLSSSAVAALVGLLAASVAVAIVRQQQVLATDRRLLDSGQLFARELNESEDALERQLADESDELAPLGMRLALFEGSRRLGGDPSLSNVGGCLSSGGLRACAVELGARRVVISGPDAELPSAWWLSVLLSSIVSAAIGAVVSRFAGSWALRSLLELEQRVSSGAMKPGDRATTAEVESLRAALEALVTRLSEALERSRVFASSAAHELRTPLATMSAELELLAAKAPAAESEAAVRVLRTLRRLSLLVDRLLALARGDLESPRPFETLALEDIVRETIAARGEQERARVSVTVEDAGMIRGDEALLGAIVDNLVDNSLKFSTGAILLKVSAAPTQVTLEISDRGPGIPADQVQALLKPFARGDTAVAGHGLGLAIISRAAELHRGSLSIEGAHVRVTFPRWTATLPALPLPAPAGRGLG